MTAIAERRSAAEAARAWPFEEARKLLKRMADKGGDGATDHVLFETGYGPSGLPHIGTFGEVARTSMVRRAFAELSDLPTRLIAFSDDMDGLRKVPDNLPNQEMLAAHLNQPLTRVPDPFGTHESFGHHNNARLRAFLDRFGFAYEFASSTDYYTSGRFDEALLRVLARHDEIRDVILPTLGAERRATYSPFLPVSPVTGEVLQVPIKALDVDAGTIIFDEPSTGRSTEVPVTGGRVKLQWKADWAMRWAALGVDYEMSGKDLIDSVKLSSRICRVLGAAPPEGFNYELFLDEHGQKISKSKGNGLTIDEWLRYGPPESLALYMFQKPRAAKRLHPGVIPRAVDDYRTFAAKAADADQAGEYATLIENPAWHIHAGSVPVAATQGGDVTFGLLLNLAAALDAEDADVLWGFVARYLPGATAESHPRLFELATYAVTYYGEVVKPTRTVALRATDATERAALADLDAALETLPEGSTTEDIQTLVYEIGKRHGFENLRDWFRALYETLLGQSEGPRMGSFIALYGIAETRTLIAAATARSA